MHDDFDYHHYFLFVYMDILSFFNRQEHMPKVDIYVHFLCTK